MFKLFLYIDTNHMLLRTYACYHTAMPYGIKNQNLSFTSHWRSLQCLIYLVSFYYPLQYHFRFSHHVFSTASWKQLLKLNSLTGLPHYIIPGGTIVSLGLCSAQPAWPYMAAIYHHYPNIEDLNFGYLYLLFRAGQLLYIN